MLDQPLCEQKLFDLFALIYVFHNENPVPNSYGETDCSLNPTCSKAISLVERVRSKHIVVCSDAEMQRLCELLHNLIFDLSIAGSWHMSEPAARAV